VALRGELLWVLHTGVGVPFIVVMGSVLFALELLVHDFFELDHFGGVEGMRLGYSENAVGAMVVREGVGGVVAA
jgi:hypothetical protein